MKALVSATLTLFLAAAATRADGPAPWTPTPSEGVAASVRDASAGGQAALYWRFCWIGDIPKEKRDTFVKVLSFHLRGLSTEPENGYLLGLTVLPGGEVVRIDTDTLGHTFQNAWENLIDFDPVYHIPLPTKGKKEIERPTQNANGYEWTWVGDYEDGRWSKNGTWTRTYDASGKRQVDRYATVAGKRDTVSAFIGWGPVTPIPAAGINAEPVLYTDYRGRKREAYIAAEAQVQRHDLEQLVALTGSAVPIVEGRWFINQTAIQEDRSPAGYADFLGFKDEDDYLRITGFSAEVLKRFPLESADAVDISTVTTRKKPRAIVVKAKAGGHLWETLDVNQPINRSNPLRIFDPDNFLKFNAKEVLAQLPNGLWAAGIFNDQGIRQDFAPQKIAFNRFGDQNNDFDVHLGPHTCLACHTKGGLNDIDYYVRGVLNKPPLTLNTLLDKKVEEERIRLRRIYTSDMDGYMDDDRRSVERAMQLTNGWKPEKTIAEYAREFEDGRSPVGPDRAAAMLGMTKDQLFVGLDKFLHSTGVIDPVVAAYLAPDPDAAVLRKGPLAKLAQGRKIQWEVFTESYPFFQLSVRQYSPVGGN